MKQKIGTVLDQRLVRRAKVYAAQRGQPLNAVFEDALRAWLDRADVKLATPSLVMGTAGNLAIDQTVLAALLAEDLYDAP
jgi:2-hydroxychromene-2-carboxylate isomerase